MAASQGVLAVRRETRIVSIGSMRQATCLSRLSFGWLTAVCVDRNPTLVYTQHLENRIKELEAQVAALRDRAPEASGSYSSPAIGPSPSKREQQEDTTSVLAGDFNGLKIDDKGVTTYYGATSFFHLLDDSRPSGKPVGSPPEGDVENSDQFGSEMRQRLVINAWQQRAQENLSQIPVGPAC